MIHTYRARCKRILTANKLVAFSCGALVLIAILATNPRVEMGVNDDFSYVYSAKVLAETGHIVYNSWAAFPIGWQLFMGALFIKIFGFSFTAVRAVNMIIGAATAPLFYQLLIRCGIRPWNALIATLSLCLSPLYLGLATGFMSDIPSLFGILLCLYACLRAVQGKTDGSKCGWLLLAILTNLVAGTVRQTVWLGVIVMIPGTLWYLRQRKAPFVIGVGAWLLSIPLIAIFLHWFSNQPYVPIESLLPISFDKAGTTNIAIHLARLPLTMFVLMIPVVVAFAARFPFRSRPWTTGILAGVTLCATGAAIKSDQVIPYMGLLLGNYIDRRGLIYMPALIGGDPDLFSRRNQALMMSAITILGIFASLSVWLAFRVESRKDHQSMDTVLAWLLGPFSLAYLALMLTRNGLFDRYLLPLVCVLLIVGCRLHARYFQKEFSRWSFVTIVVFAVFGILGVHDAFSLRRARLAAANVLVSAGVPRSEFRAGFEYDAWTQIMIAGHLNEERVKNPSEAFHKWIQPATMKDACKYPFQGYTPDIKARYGVTNEKNFCYPDAGLPPIRYTTLLPFRERILYFVAIPQPAD